MKTPKTGFGRSWNAYYLRFQCAAEHYDLVSKVLFFEGNFNQNSVETNVLDESVGEVQAFLYLQGSSGWSNIK